MRTLRAEHFIADCVFSHHCMPCFLTSELQRLLHQLGHPLQCRQLFTPWSPVTPAHMLQRQHHKLDRSDICFRKICVVLQDLLGGVLDLCFSTCSRITHVAVSRLTDALSILAPPGAERHKVWQTAQCLASRWSWKVNCHCVHVEAPLTA